VGHEAGLDGLSGLARRRFLLAPFGVAVAAASGPARAEWLRDGIVIYADPELRPVLTELDAQYQRSNPGSPTVFSAPPGQLLGLLAHDTQNDVLLTQSAFMDRAVAQKLVQDVRHTLWRNRLVVAGRAGAATLGDFRADALKAALKGGVLAVPDASDASAVDGPALLEKLGLSVRVQGAVSTGDGLDMLRGGHVALAVCHATELTADPGLVRVMALPDEAYPPIVYQAALTAKAWSRYQSPWLAYLSGGAAALARQSGLEVLA
jgi:molybdate transport system substrate-binding protein